MIILSGNYFDISEIINQYDHNSIERYLLEKMSASDEKYQYDYLDQLRFELIFRKEIIKAAIDLYKSRINFAVFNKSKANPKYWNRTNNGGFELKQGAVQADAINNIFENGNAYATECATAMVIVYYKALLNIFSKDDFNKLFPKIYLMNWHNLDPLLREIGYPKKVKDILPGDRGYFKNPDVDPKTPELQGENVIVLLDDLYYGHGIGIESAEEIISALNRSRRSGATQSAYFMDSVSRPDFKRFADIYYSLHS